MTVAPITVVSWNVLSDSYVDEERCPHLDPAMRAPGSRVSALCETLEVLVASTSAAVICLQEVDQALAGCLCDFGSAHWTPRPGSVEGCALVVTGPLRLLDLANRVYQGHDHVAQRAIIGCGGWSATIYNTHLRWTPDGRATYEQGRQLARWLQAETEPFVVAGDLNAAPGSPTVAELLSAGCIDAHQAWPDIHTASFPEVGPVRVDYILVSRATCIADRPPPIDVPLPSKAHPSDHIPLMARLTFSGV
jgi:endonuclease/exonuclease/phosphatase (EEP) superfamily protein YafD